MSDTQSIVWAIPLIFLGSCVLCCIACCICNRCKAPIEPPSPPLPTFPSLDSRPTPSQLHINEDPV